MPDPAPEGMGGIAARLWPGARLSRTPSGRAYAVFPSAADPRFLLPADPRLARAALRARTAPSRRIERWRNGLLGLGLRWGGRRVLVRDYVVPPDDGIVGHLSELLGAPVVASVHLGPPRSNRKPVLTLLGRRGDVVAYAKVGIDPLTCELVRHEGAALELLAAAPLRGVTIPRVLHRGEWNGLDVLVLEALRLDPTAAPSTESLALASGAIAAATGTDERPAASIVDDLLDRALAIDAPGVQDVRDCLLELRARDGGLGIACGGWHGDFAPGNVAAPAGHGPDLVVLDLERHVGSGIPLGSDLLHHRVRSLSDVAGVGMSRALAQVASEGTALLARVGVGADAAPVVLRLYVARLLLRYLADGQPLVADPATSVRPWLAAATSGPASM